MYKDILTLIKYNYDLLQAENLWFKVYIKTTTLKSGFKQCKTDSFLLYRVNKLGTVIVIIYIYDMLEMGDKPAFMNMI